MIVLTWKRSKVNDRSDYAPNYGFVKTFSIDSVLLNENMHDISGITASEESGYTKKDVHIIKHQTYKQTNKQTNIESY